MDIRNEVDRTEIWLKFDTISRLAEMCLSEITEANKDSVIYAIKSIADDGIDMTII